jgi:hypothetical protein
MVQNLVDEEDEMTMDRPIKHGVINEFDDKRGRILIGKVADWVGFQDPVIHGLGVFLSSTRIKK